MEANDKKAAGERVELAVGTATNGATMPRAPAAMKAPVNGVTAHHTNGATPSLSDAAAPGAETGPEGEPGGDAGLVVSPDYVPAVRQSDVSAWLTAYDAIQCRTAEAHAVYQQAMAQCHLAFLRAAEQSALALASLATGAPLAPPEPRALNWTPPQPLARPQAASASGLAPVAHAAHAVVAPPPQPVSQVKKLDVLVHRAPVVRSPVVAPAVPAAPAPRAAGPAAVVPPAPKAAPAPAMPGPAPAPSATQTAIAAALAAAAKSNGGLVLPADGDLKSFLFSIVADKTGYPVDILNLDQQLEADLGIDSIKRVEILSAFEGQIQNIQDVNLEEVAQLNTLRDVLGFMERNADKLGLEKKN
jgi:acyl carrier protein